MFAVNVYRSIYLSSLITQILYSGAITLIGMYLFFWYIFTFVILTISYFLGFFKDEIPGDGCMSHYNSILCYDSL